jgi:hypothetical protein
MRNQGKVQRVIRELVATLVDELGPDEAAEMLEMAATKLRGAGRGLKQSAEHDGRSTTARPRVVGSR